MIKKIRRIGLIGLIGLIGPIGLLAATQLQVNIPCQQVPGAAGCPEITGPAAYIARVYQFGLAAAGILALGVIVFAAVEYTISAGNPSLQQDARDRITQAIFGLVLLFGAYLILYTINPGLVNLANPTTEIIRPPRVSTADILR